MMLLTTALAWVLIIFSIGAIALPFWYRWLDYKQEQLRIGAQLQEVLACYDSEQSFLDIEDDPEHLESISPDPIEVPLQRADQIVNLGGTQHGPSHHPGEWSHTEKKVTTWLPWGLSMTEDERAAIAAELAAEEEENA